MKIEKQVCSLELAKELKELGVKQDSLFCWHRTFGTIKAETEEDWQIKYGKYENSYSAFTVAELGELLPVRISFACNSDYYKKGFKDVSLKYDFGYIKGVAHSGDICVRSRLPLLIDCSYWDGKHLLALQQSTSEANCRAKMLIHLIKEGLVKV